MAGGWPRRLAPRMFGLGGKHPAVPGTDIVIAWVDGGDPVLAAKRDRYLAAGPAQEQLATKARRFTDNDEIRFALRSIYNFAPWVRKVWLVTDEQTPPCIDPMTARAYNIEIVDHRAIYSGFEGFLPVFNSLALETMLWRVPGLADQFVYFNDDMMLTAPTEETDFFRDGRAVLRGQWTSFVDKQVSFHGGNQLEGARLYGLDEKRLYSNAHIPYAMLRPVMAAAFEQHTAQFARNMAFRFRNRSQFWPMSAHAYQAMRMGRSVFYEGKSDWRHFSVNFCKTATREQLLERLELLRTHRVKMTCVNYFEPVAEKIPKALDYLSEATGPRAPFEIGEPALTNVADAAFV